MSDKQPIIEFILSEYMTPNEFCDFYGMTRRNYDFLIRSKNCPPFHWKGEGTNRKRVFIRSELMGWRKPSEAKR